MSTPRARRTLGTLAAAAVVLAAPTLADAAAGRRAEAVVRVKLFQFAPDTVRVAAGTRVRWVNDDETRHTATSEPASPGAARFDVALDGRGASGAATFTRPGVHRYHCALHPHMTAVVVVTSTPTPSSP